MFIVKDDRPGEIILSTDRSPHSADIQQRIRNLGTAVGPNGVDVTGTDVVEATGLTIAG